MKLSELSFREYIALEALPALAGTMPDKDAAWRAFSLADEFLKRAGREHDKVAEIKRECDRLEAQNVLLMHMGEDFSARVALLQLWEFLGVENQTAAMQALRDLRDGIKQCLDAERARLADLKPGAPASQYTAERIEKLERLVQ